VESAAREQLEQEQVWGLHRREEEARAERSERRSTALERRVAALQEELAGVGKSLAEGGEDGGRGAHPILYLARCLASIDTACGHSGASVVKISQQLTWYSEQLESSQNNGRRLQREADRLARENLALSEKLAAATAAVAAAASGKTTPVQPRQS